MNKLYFPYIDILRAFAAISVLIYHVIEHFNWSSFPTDGVLFWFRIGWAGVDLFFVISGFVICMSAIKLYEKHPDKFRIIFMERRLFRIVPLYFLTIFIFLVLVSPELFFKGIFFNLGTHLIFIHNIFPQYHGAINGVNWSIGTEVQFYVLMVFIGPYIVRIGAIKLLTVFILIAWVWRVSVFYLFDTNSSFETFLYSTQLPGTLDQFGMGVLLAFFLNSARGKAVLAVSQINYRWLVFVLILLVFLSTVSFSIYLPRASYWNHPEMLVFFRTLLSLTFMALVFFVCLIPRSYYMDKVFAIPMYLGKISYGIYLWHLIVILSFKRVDEIEPLLVLPYVFFSTVILAAFSYHFFEKPFMSMGSTRKLTK